MGGRGTAAARNSGNINFKVTERWSSEELTSFESKEVENAVNEMKSEVKRVLELANYDVDRAYEYLADAYPFALYDDEAVKIVNNRDDHNIIAVDVRMHEWGGKISVGLSPIVFDESDFNTREELDAIGLHERRR